MRQRLRVAPSITDNYFAHIALQQDNKQSANNKTLFATDAQRTSALASRQYTQRHIAVIDQGKNTGSKCSQILRATLQARFSGQVDAQLRLRLAQCVLNNIATQYKTRQANHREAHHRPQKTFRTSTNYICEITFCMRCVISSLSYGSLKAIKMVSLPDIVPNICSIPPLSMLYAIELA